MKVFISGSIRVTTLMSVVEDRLQTLVADNVDILIGDAAGVDRAVQEYLRDAAYRSVTVYCSGGIPRNNVGSWPVVAVDSTEAPGTRAHFTAKDRRMVRDCDSGLLIWDGRSRGTRRNAIELLEKDKRAVIYLAQNGQFHEMLGVDAFERLLAGVPHG